jgi:hypothetical protein
VEKRDLGPCRICGGRRVKRRHDACSPAGVRPAAGCWEGNGESAQPRHAARPPFKSPFRSALFVPAHPIRAPAHPPSAAHHARATFSASSVSCTAPHKLAEAVPSACRTIFQGTGRLGPAGLRFIRPDHPSIYLVIYADGAKSCPLTISPPFMAARKREDLPTLVTAGPYNRRPLRIPAAADAVSPWTPSNGFAQFQTSVQWCCMLSCPRRILGND